MGDIETSRGARSRAWLAAITAGDRLWIALSSGMFLLAALPFLALARFNQPTADDFCLINRVVAEGFWGFNRSIYLGWTGRFFTTVLYGAFYLGSIVFARAWVLAFQLVAVATFLALTGAVFVSVRAWAAHAWQGAARAWGITAVVVAASVLGMPSLYEGLYWAASSLQYALSVVWALGLVAAAAALLPSSPPGRRRVTCGVLALLLTAAAVGSNETIAAPVFAFLAIMLRASWRDRTCRAWWLAIGAVALLAVAVTLAAPGNYLRLKHVAPFGVGETLTHTGRLLVTTLRAWLSPALVTSVVLIAGLSLGAEAPLPRRWPHPFLVGACMLAVLAGMLLPSVWAYRGAPPRVMSTVYLVFMLLASVWSLHFTVYLRARYPVLFTHLCSGAANHDVRMVICALAALACLKAPNLRAMRHDLGQARAFREATEQRYAIAAVAEPGSAITFAPLSTLPTSLTTADLSSDPRDWKNACFAARFGLLSVHTEPPAAHGAR